MTPISKLGLGTVQFGLDYGISNTSGQTSVDEVKRILKHAGEAGIQVLDTASLYGNSEDVLGKTIEQSNNFRIITKTPAFTDPITPKDGELLISTFYESLKRLNLKEVDGLLIHQAADLLNKNSKELFDSLQALKESGLVNKIGVSVYTLEQLDSIFSRYKLDMVQLPVNVYDQSILKDGILKNLHSNGVEVHARSAFLQGLLLMPPNELPDYFEPIKEHHHLWYQAIQSADSSPLAAALGFTTQLDCIDTVVCGVNSTEQLEEIIDAVNKPPKLDYGGFALNNPQYTSPVNWPRKH